MLKSRHIFHQGHYMRLFTAVFAFIIASHSSLFAGTEIEKSISHVVICWLKDPKDTEARTRLIQVSKELETLEEVASVTVGEMIPSQRPIVDSSYDIAVIMQFKDRQQLEKYQKNPLHKKALKEVLIPLTSKVLIYDFVSI